MKWMLIFLTAMSSSCFAATETDSKLLKKWLALEQQSGALKQNWAERKLRLQQQLSLLEQEQTALEALIKDNQDSSGLVSKQRLELTQKQTLLETEQAALAQNTDALLHYISELHKRFPPPLYSTWQEELAQLEAIKDNSEKLELALRMIKQATDFNSRIAKHTALLAVSHQGQTQQVLVEQIYLGLGHGWYLSSDQKYFGYGRSSQHGWQWWHGEAVNQVLPMQTTKADIARVIRILKTPTQAQYVQLPIALSNEQAGAL
ncbi:MAG: hypothetical protein CMK64_14560 [Pseudoalteromonas sp.]|nr:hypothetical protein [Pseudoalteromonas sp.]|tara:strand:- start:5853 stop:6635 length:783 start_codon:yes stop_codon:yes gene_type:complete